MALSLNWVTNGVYTIRDSKWGWEFCTISISIEAQEKLPEHEIETLLKKLVTDTNLLLGWEDENG
jgi:hypothetical protein